MPDIGLETTETENAKHPGGYQKDKVWSYFENRSTKHPGHFDTMCKFCDKYWKVGLSKNYKFIWHENVKM